MHFLTRSFFVWLLFIPLAVMNGMVRDLLLLSVLGETAGRAVSSISLSLLIFGLTLLFIKRLGVGTRRDCLLVGGSWLALTLLFEFSFFVLVMGHPLDVLLQDYDLFRGRLWLLVLATTFLAPLFAAWARDLLRK